MRQVSVLCTFLCYAHITLFQVLRQSGKSTKFFQYFLLVFTKSFLLSHAYSPIRPHFLHKSQISTPFSLWFNTSHAHIMHIIHTLCTHPVSVNFEDFQDGLTRVFRKIAKNASNFQVGLSSNPGCGYWTHLLKDMYM